MPSSFRCLNGDLIIRGSICLTGTAAKVQVDSVTPSVDSNFYKVLLSDAVTKKSLGLFKYAKNGVYVGYRHKREWDLLCSAEAMPVAKSRGITKGLHRLREVEKLCNA